MGFDLAGFIFFIIRGLFGFISFALFAYAILSWLVAFNIVNTRNRAVYMIMDMLDRITAPVLAPFRMIIPPLGGLDISFLVAILVIQAIEIYLLGPAENTLRALLGG